jgi:hypothetical protein
MGHRGVDVHNPDLSDVFDFKMINLATRGPRRGNKGLLAWFLMICRA